MLYNRYNLVNFKGEYSLDKIKISNPLTIIGIFAGLSEVAMVTALPFIREDLQGTFIWFVMIFPLLLVTLFFITLNKNPRVLYSPSDFKDENLFIKTMNMGRKSILIDSDTPEQESPINLMKNKIFTDQRVILDNHHFVNCQFINCEIVFLGTGELISIDNCNFNNVVWVFNGAAATTLTFLTTLNSKFGEEGKEIVDKTIDNIRNGVY